MTERVITLIGYLGKPAGTMINVPPHMRPKYEALGLIEKKKFKKKTPKKATTKPKTPKPADEEKGK